jgi:hypothetical protein
MKRMLRLEETSLGQSLLFVSETSVQLLTNVVLARYTERCLHNFIFQFQFTRHRILTFQFYHKHLIVRTKHLCQIYNVTKLFAVDIIVAYKHLCLLFLP